MKSISVTLKELLMKVNQFREFFFLRVPGIKTGEELGFNRIAAFSSWILRGEEYVLSRPIYSANSTRTV